MARTSPQNTSGFPSKGLASGLPCAPPKETAADFAKRELEEIANRMEIISNRLSAAKKRLQEHFGVPVADSAMVSANDPLPPGMDGVRKRLDELDTRLGSIADGFEELI